MLLDQVSEDLRVRIRLEFVTPTDQLGPQHIGVLNDAVMANGDFARAVRVGMGVAGGGFSVGGPARMGNPGLTHEGLFVEQVAEGFEPAGGAPSLQADPVLDRHARGVVTPVLEAAEGFEEDGARLLGSGVGDDSTHAR